jgi:signal transduction histidine kinase
MAVVLTLAAAFAYFRVRADLDQAINDGLQARSAAVNALVSHADTGLSQNMPAGGEQNYAQVLTPSGRVFDASPGATQPALNGQQIKDALRSPILTDTDHALGIPGVARVVATTVHAQDRTLIVVVGAAIDDRNQALTELKHAFVIGAPAAILIAGGIGYLLASLALVPVERMRRRAEMITATGEEERLPLPPAADELRRLGETLNAMLERLDRSMRRERRFIADASHELRTPITVLKSELEVAVRNSKLPPSELSSVRSALEEADRLTQLAEDLLVLARSDEGRLPVRRERAIVTQLLERASRPFARQAEERDRQISIDAPEGLRADVDPLRIEQALHNLIDNSLRHGSGAIRVSAQSEDGGLVFAVADEGPGFATDQRERVFERFTHGEGDGASGGSGLGLAIVRTIAEAHGGNVWIASNGSAGADVRMRIPSVPHDARR